MTSRTATRRRSPAPPPPSPSPSRLVVLVAAGAVFALVLLLGIAIATSGGDDDPTGTTEAAFGPVEVEGTALTPYVADDSAAGALAPTLFGLRPDGTPLEVGGGGQPTLIAFLAHWCPHCQAELPLLVELAADGAFDGVRTVAVLTGTNPDAPNYPPVAWLDREGWAGDVLLDDEASTAAAAYGLEGYPFLVALDGEGRVVGRTSGEVPAADVAALAVAARGDA